LHNFKVSKSSYFRAQNVTYERDQDDLKVIKAMFEKHKEKVGIRQLKMLIERDTGLVINHKKIARIKRKFRLVTRIRRKNKFRLFIKKNQEHKTFPNLLDRKFDQQKPNKVYSIDITQINYGHKKSYLAAVKDLCTKEIVGKSISNRIDIRLTNSAVDKALKRITVKERKNLMIHSDQGFHFTHFSYREKLKENGVTQSMSRKGNCIDNAPIESFFGQLKDLLDLSNCKKHEDLEKEVTKQINYYNHRRPQLGLKKKPPSEYRRHMKL
tara:strand:- start:153 stop:956 length:804 start_codon:yes stop_codon:yes gene_type:complete